MVTLLILQNFAFAVPLARAANTCTFTGAGDGTTFSSSANWTECGGVAPQSGDDVVVPGPFGMIGSTSSVGSTPGKPFVAGNLVYVPNQSGTVSIVDVTDPTSPFITGTISVSQPKYVYVAGTYAYITNMSANTFEIWDVTDPTSPSFVSSTYVGGAFPQASGIAVSGNYAFITDRYYATLKVFDVSNPASPSFVTSVADAYAPEDIVIQGNYAYTTSAYGLYIFDISTPTSPVRVATGFSSGEAYTIDVKGNYAYLSNNEDTKTRIIDISDPTNPSTVYEITDAEDPKGVAASGSFLFVTIANSKFKVYDITTPSSPVLVTTQSFAAGSQMAITGDYAYIPGYSGSFRVYPSAYSTGTAVLDATTTINSLHVLANADLNMVTYDLTVAGGVVNDGSIDNGSGTLNIGGDYNGIIGSINGDTGTTNFNGTNQTITGGTVFNNLTKQTATADTLTFGDGYSYTVTGTLTLNGAAGNLLSLRSVNPGNQWYIDPQGTRAIGYVDVEDSYNSNASAIAAGTGSIDSGDNFNWNFASPPPPGSNTTDNYVALSRIAVNATVTATVHFVLNETMSTQLSVIFDPAFTGLDVGSASALTPGAPGCMSNFVATGPNSFTADKSSCTGEVTITGVTVTNPGAAGSYLVSWTNDDSGYAMVAITDDDQVNVNAQVDPTITFDLNTGATNAPVSAPYSVALGSLTTGAVSHSDNAGVNSVWANLDTNATGGAVVTVLSANAALASLSVPSDTIPNAAASMSAGTANYGLCVNSVTPPSAANGAFQASAPYDSGTCDPAGSANAVKALSTVTPTSILDSNANPVTTGAAEILVNAAISTATAAHSDYADVLTFVATGTF